MSVHQETITQMATAKAIKSIHGLSKNRCGTLYCMCCETWARIRNSMSMKKKGKLYNVVEKSATNSLYYIYEREV